MTFGAFMAICKTALYQYVSIFLQSDLFFSQLRGVSGTTTINQLTQNNFNDFWIPIPPANEQKRIVEKLQNVSPFIERYSKSQETLNLMNIQIKEQLKKSILQEAIQGKLVPQIAEEGTAQELLEQIRQEKQKLVKEGKLKKSVLTDSVIYKGDDNKYYERINEQIVEIELPFEYPNSWVVLRLKDICQLIDGEKRTGKGICLDAKYLRGKSSAAVIDKGKFVYAGDNIILVDGENSGEVFSVPQDGYMGSTFKQLWLSSVMWKPYILAFILFYKEELKNSKRGAAIPHLNKELFHNLPIGIPPFAEQNV
jgi:type I restriction enzyme S subunit